MAFTAHRFALENLPPERRQILESFYAGHLPAGQLVHALSRADAPVRTPDDKPRQRRVLRPFAKRIGFAG